MGFVNRDNFEITGVLPPNIKVTRFVNDEPEVLEVIVALLKLGATSVYVEKA